MTHPRRTPVRRAARAIARPDPAVTVARVTIRALAATALVLTLFAARDVFAQGARNDALKPSSVAGASTAAADAAYDRAAKQWSTLKSVEARFEQRITNPLLGRTMTSKGTFLQQRPGKVAITFTDPVGDRIVGDGKFLWVYLPSSTPGQVMKLPANAEGAVVADMLGQLLDSPRRSFTISGGEAATIDGRTTRRVQLVPRDASTSAFQRATLWIDDRESRPVRVQVVDGQGVDRLITLLSWSPDVTIKKDAFTFAVPKGAKVVTKVAG